MTDMKGSTSLGTDTCALYKEWDDALCPICMDHPHNAVLLLCSSFDKGCRPYICDSSYRHSNCLDRFKKYFRDGPSEPESSLIENSENSRLDTSDSIVRAIGSRNNLTEANEHNMVNENNNGSSDERLEVVGDTNREGPHRYIDMVDGSSLGRRAFEQFSERIGGEYMSASNLNLKCPLCRGSVKSWEIVEEARQYLDLKQRSCSLESCSFLGNYGELRRHARRVHPTTRPAIVDQSRQRNWRHLEHQQEYGDIVSAIRSAMPGAIVLGDYVIETGDGFSAERDNISGENSGRLLTSFILYQMMRPFSPASEPRSLSRAWRRYRRTSGGFSDRRHLWGENLLGLQEDDAEWNLSSDMGEDVPPIPRRRRRYTRSRTDEDLP
ncbi:hypothetical protein AQUCO_03400234v1 [Aquilegia coerulea]|uniref:Uncharacterized protein n=1 Tax=Aquilegia coerulea TaxID=218851 RepID=A0A2G5CZ30_AQUCA|nr:hypothetical protein AQUCO_03400234v1 [Aquilegia coerulea]PIA36176.1 hypothetical protein AQUCO_03400234v1 [Aquilegia coerulea]PIA36177.1 hypothetical protein AQUCO_03400234v1 [Aquilegia coerulea]